MITIGIRAKPGIVAFAVYDTEDDEIVVVDKIVVPKSFGTPDALKYVRSHLLDILREYKVVRAVIRATEPTAQRLSIERIEIEGVIQESFASSNLESYSICYARSMMSRLGRPVGDLKLLVDGEIDPEVENWSEMNKEAREAILSAMGAVNA